MHRSVKGLLTVGAFLGSALAAGCGPTCQATCSRLYYEDECGVPSPGRDTDDAFRDCVNMCEDALSQPGEMGIYDPDERITSGESVVLQNEVQAAAWMECVAETACDQIEDGYCEPH